MSKSFMFVFIFNLSVCYLCSSSYFHFDRIIIEFAKSFNDGHHLNFHLHSLRYINWIVPLCAPFLICFIKPFRFSLHQGFIYNVVCLFFMNVIFYILEFFFLTNGSSNLHSILTKLWILQIVHSFILSAIYWINFSSLISNFQDKDVLLISCCYTLVTILGSLDRNLAFKSYYLVFELATLLHLLIFYFFLKMDIEIKDDFKSQPMLNLKNHVLKLPIVLSSFCESFFIGCLLFLYFLPTFGLFLLTFIPNVKDVDSLSKIYIAKLNGFQNFSLLIGVILAIFLISTFAHSNIKKTIWSMFAKNCLFVYVWSLMFDFKVPYHYFNGAQSALFFFAISINVLIQSGTIIESLRANVFEKDKTVFLFTPGIISLGILSSWLVLSIGLGLKLHNSNMDLLEYQLYYLFSGFLICLFLCTFHQIMTDDYSDLPIRISRPILV